MESINYKFSALVIFLIFISNPQVNAQSTSAMNDPKPIYEQGLSVSIIGSFELTWSEGSGFMGSRSYNLAFKSFAGGVNTIYGIQYRGKVYHDYHFDGALKDYFAALRVRSINYYADINGLKDENCRRMSVLSATAGGNGTSRFCEPDGESVWIRQVVLTRVFLEGVGDLQNKIDEMEREVIRIAREKEEQLKREQQEKEERERLEKLAREKEKLERAEQDRLEKLKQQKEQDDIMAKQQSDLDLKRTEAENDAARRREEDIARHREHLRKLEEISSTPEAIDYRAKRMMSAALELEGNQLWAMGSMYAFQAYQKYEQAQKIFYTPGVQTKMNEIGGYVQLAQGLSALGDIIGNELDEIVMVIDPESKTSWSHFGLYHVGDPSALGDPFAKDPTATYFLYAMNFLAISLDMQVNYHVLPIQTYSIYSEGWNRVLTETAEMTSSMYGAGFSFGVNIIYRLSAR